MQVAWAIGGNPVSFPAEAGLPFGEGADFKYALLEVHYDVKCYTVLSYLFRQNYIYITCDDYRIQQDNQGLWIILGCEFGIRDN